MSADLKYFDGSLAKIDRIPQDIRSLYATAFEVDPAWVVEAGSRRQTTSSTIRAAFLQCSNRSARSTKGTSHSRQFRSQFVLRG